MASNEITIHAGASSPPHQRHREDAVWWYATDEETVGYAGAIPWNFDNALFLCCHEAPPQRFDLRFALLKVFVSHAEDNDYDGCWAMTYTKDSEMPVVLRELGFHREEFGRQWSDNPTVYWYRSAKP